MWGGARSLTSARFALELGNREEFGIGCHRVSGSVTARGRRWRRTLTCGPHVSEARLKRERVRRAAGPLALGLGRVGGWAAAWVAGPSEGEVPSWLAAGPSCCCCAGLGFSSFFYFLF